LLHASQNSTLVLTSENRSRDAHEPTGEPETLWGRMGKTKMGDRVRRETVDKAKDKKKADAKKKRGAAQARLLHADQHHLWLAAPAVPATADATMHCCYRRGLTSLALRAQSAAKRRPVG
jgi:hypothetical protein